MARRRLQRITAPLTTLSPLCPSPHCGASDSSGPSHSPSLRPPAGQRAPSPSRARAVTTKELLRLWEENPAPWRPRLLGLLPGPACNQSRALFEGLAKAPLLSMALPLPNPAHVPPPWPGLLISSFQVQSTRWHTTAWSRLTKMSGSTHPSRSLQAPPVSSASQRLHQPPKPRPSQGPSHSPATSTPGAHITPTACAGYVGWLKKLLVPQRWRWTRKGGSPCQTPVRAPPTATQALEQREGRAGVARQLRYSGASEHEMLTKKKDGCQS